MVTEVGLSKARAIGSGLSVPEENRTVEALLTDSTTGTANDTLVDVGAVFNQGTLNDNFADLAAKVNMLLAELHDRGVADAA